MQSPDHRCELSTLAIADAESVASLRLLEQSGRAVLLLSRTGPRPGSSAQHQTVISMIDVAGAPEKATDLFTIPQLLPSVPQWDGALKTGVWLIVLQEAGGALNSLAVYSSGAGGVAPVSRKHPFRDFSGPRFVQGKPPFVSAIVDSKRLVVFAARTVADYGDAVEVTDADDGELITVQDGYILCAKDERMGQTRGDVSPGILRWARLDGQFNQQKVLIAPFGDQMVFEFRAQLIDDSPAVLATLSDELKLAALVENTVHALQFTLPENVREVQRPALCTAGREVHVAALAAPRSRDARVLYGRVPIPQVIPEGK